MKEDVLKERIVAFFSYINQLIRLGLKNYTDVEKESLDFIRYSHEILQLPGVFTFHLEENNFYWLTVHKQKISQRPQLPEILDGWVKVFEDPEKEPELIEDRSYNGENIGFYDDEKRVDEYLKYLEEWEKWSKEVVHRYNTQRLYRELFKVNELLKYDEGVELIWGYGILLWKNDQFKIRYPLITQRLNIQFFPEKGVINILPDEDKKPFFEMEVLKDTTFPSIIDLREEFEEKLELLDEIDIKDGLSPLSFFTDILKKVAGKLSSEGEFLELKGELIPDNSLKIVDEWVIFLRKKRQDAIMRDIDSIIEKYSSSNGSCYIFIDNDTILEEYFKTPEEREFHPIKAEKYTNEWDVLLDDEVLFPKPANEEQIKILNYFEESKGVVVWGPPGTGKSHTIANLICHFMAQGKRVLVTSQKDQALSVLRKMLPEPLRPLCMSVLSYVSNSREMLSNAVSTISEIVSKYTYKDLMEDIENIRGELSVLKEKLIKTEKRMKELSKNQFRLILIDDKEFLPAEAIKKLKEEKDSHSWFVDIPKYNLLITKYKNREKVKIIVNIPLSDSEMEKLKMLRRKLLNYFPELALNIPESDELIDEDGFQKMAEMLKYEKEIKNKINIQLPYLLEIDDNDKRIDDWREEIKRNIKIYTHISNKEWTLSLYKKLKDDVEIEKKIREDYRSLNLDATKLKSYFEKFSFLHSISLPKEVELEKQGEYLNEVLSLYKSGKNPFSFIRKLFRSKKISFLKKISFDNRLPRTFEEWKYISDYVDLLVMVKEMKLKWNNLANSFDMPKIRRDFVSERDALEIFSFLSELEKILSFLEGSEKVNKIFSEIGIFDELNKELMEKVYNVLNFKLQLRNFKVVKEKYYRLKKYLNVVKSKGNAHPIVDDLIDLLQNIGDVNSINDWGSKYKKIRFLEKLKCDYGEFKTLHNKLKLQFPLWAEKWINPEIREDDLIPSHWKRSIFFKAIQEYVNKILEEVKELNTLDANQRDFIVRVRKLKEELILNKVKYGLLIRLRRSEVEALKRWQLAVKKLGKGKGKYAWRKEKLIKKEMKMSKNAVPVWIMSLYKVSEMLPSEAGMFDVVIVDESSQCDIRSFVSLFRGKKCIIVGDPEQISPEGIGINKEEINQLMQMYLKDVPNREYYDLETSLYDISNIVFTGREVMLKEHFRCVPEIIRFNNRLCYDNKILPLRNPSSEKKLIPVLESYYVPDGHRKGRWDVNEIEAQKICEKVREIIRDPKFEGKTIGVISLLGKVQAKYIFNIIGNYITPEEQEIFDFRVGDAYDFQGDERDIIILSMVISSQDEKKIFTLSHDIKRYRQRFNVAVSRAKDKLILFHSIKLEELNNSDLRYILLYYIENGNFPEESEKVIVEEHFESPFERDVYNWLTKRGYKVIPQVEVGHYRIDLVIENGDLRVGIECDGEKWHPPERWWEDMLRERQLERMGWTIIRVWGSDFYKNPDAAMEIILDKLRNLTPGIDKN